MILKPIGAYLPCCDLPGRSFINTKVVESPDGMPDLEMTHPAGPGPWRVSISDLRTILDWASKP